MIFLLYIGRQLNRPHSPALDIVPIPLDVLAGQELAEVEDKALEAEKLLQTELPQKRYTTAELPQRRYTSVQPSLKRYASAELPEKRFTTVQPPQKRHTTADLPHTKVEAASEKPKREESGHAGVRVIAKTGQRDIRPGTLIVPGNKGPIAEDDDDADDDYGAAYNGYGSLDMDNFPSSIADEDLGLRPWTSSPVNEVDTPQRKASPEPEEVQDSATSEVGSQYTNDTVVLGLRVYTHRDAPAVISGQLRKEMKASPAAYAQAAL